MLRAGLLGPFQIGNEGPSGWWIIDEPEIHFVLDIDVATQVQIISIIVFDFKRASSLTPQLW